MEAALILIAFVIVAAALVFVVLNMGFATSQKAKTSITSALGGASNTILISGKVIGAAPAVGGVLNATMIPLKLTSNGESVDLSYTKATISYLGETIEYDNIYYAGCTLTGQIYADPITAWGDAAPGCVGISPFAGAPTQTNAIIYWVIANQVPPNSFLEPGEHAVLSIGWSQAPDERPGDLEKIKIELAASGSATLTIERQLPFISGSIVDLS